MPVKQPKKLLILNILDILRKYSDEEHRLSQKDIAEILKTEYDMTADRKAIRRNILNLMDCGYNIEYSESIRMVPNPKTGVPEESYLWSDFYLERDFTDGELRLLIDSLLFSKHVPYSQCKELVGKLEELSDGVYKLDDLPYGDYTLKETEAPKGFFLDEKTYSFSIKEDGKTVVVENEAGKGFVNQAQTGGIRIEKTSDDGVLKGFTFRVEGSDITGNAFSKDFVTDEKGQIHIEGLRIGDYVISEVSNKANEKYELPANVTVTVHEGKTVVAKFHNKLKPVTDIPKTGDTTNMPLWAALAGISAIGAGAAAFFTFRKKKEVGKHER